MFQLSSAAKIAGLDVLTYVAGHLWPPVIAGDQFEGFEPTWVACDVRVVVLLDYPLAKLAVFRHVNLFSEHHHPLRLRPLCTPHQPSSSIPLKFARCFCYRLLLLIVSQAAPDVPENLALRADYGDCGERVNSEEFRGEQGHVVVVVLSTAMIGST